MSFTIGHDIVAKTNKNFENFFNLFFTKNLYNVPTLNFYKILDFFFALLTPYLLLMRDFNNSIFPQKIVQGSFNTFLHFYNHFFTFFENRPFDFTMFYHWDLIKIFKNRPSSVFSFICTYIPKITIFENRPRSVLPILCMQPSKTIKFYKKFF